MKRFLVQATKPIRGMHMSSIPDCAPLVMFPQLPPVSKAADRIATLLECKLGFLGQAKWRFLREAGINLEEEEEGYNKSLRPEVLHIVGWRTERLPADFEANLFQGQAHVSGGFVTFRPDWICDVLSPSTQDWWGLRAKAYSSAGVPHFWLVCPHRRRLIVFENGNKVEDYVDPQQPISPAPFGEKMPLDLAWTANLPLLTTPIPGVDSD